MCIMGLNMNQTMLHSVIRHGLVRIFYPCLMIFGTIGNILCLKILLRKRFRRQSTCQYLCILAVIDILFIYMRSSRYLYRMISDVDLRNTSLWVCRTFIFFSSTLSHLASWILVIVSFDRYFIIRNLFLRRRVGSRVIKSTVILILIISIVNLHYFHILGTDMSFEDSVTPLNDSSDYTTYFMCVATSSYEEFFHLYVPIFDLLFVAIIPFCLMVFTNIGIIRTTMHSNMLCATSRKQQRNNRLSVMLLSVTLAFMLLTCPSVIYICLNRLTPSITYSDTKLVVLDLLEALWYTKHALNFILYTLSGQDFRREFGKLISCSQRRPANSLTSHQRSQQNNGFALLPSAIYSKSPMAKDRPDEHEKDQSIDEIDGISPMIMSKLPQRKNTNHTNSRIDSSFIVFSSSAPTGTSILSGFGRSSSIARASIR